MGITDRAIRANCPDLILVLKETRQALMIDFSCPFNFNVVHKEIEKIDKYQSLLIDVIPIVIGSLGPLSP